LINSLPASYGTIKCYLNLVLPIFAKPIKITPIKIKAAGSENRTDSLLPRSQREAIIEGGIIDINIGFIIFTP
jgi:hypothetical protein